MAKRIHVSELVVRQQISSRGGGVEIDLTRKGFSGQKMSAYQNYLGGGMLGSIQTNDTIRRETLRGKQTDAVNKKLDKIALELAQYFHSLTNHEDDEWESCTFEEGQRRGVSGY